MLWNLHDGNPREKCTGPYKRTLIKRLRERGSKREIKKKKRREQVAAGGEKKQTVARHLQVAEGFEEKPYEGDQEEIVRCSEETCQDELQPGKNRSMRKTVEKPLAGARKPQLLPLPPLEEP